MVLDDLIQLAQKGEINPKYLEKVKDEWNRFVEGETVNEQIIPREILNSWVRSKDYGVDPYSEKLNVFGSSQKSKQEELSGFLQRFNFYFSNISEVFDFNDYILSYKTNNGIAQILYEKEGIPFANAIGDCSEKEVGTNSGAIALWEDRPTLLLQPFHYRQGYYEKNYEKYHSASAPIHNNRGEVIGGLNTRLSRLRAM